VTSDLSDGMQVDPAKSLMKSELSANVRDSS
jgi:hypothetical protein